LSANRQSAIQRTKWDLGFYADANEFRVILNSSTAMMAKQIDKNDLNAVTSADTAGFASLVVFSQTEPTVESMAFIDHPSGDLDKTAIAPISATASENKVYIINRGLGIGNPAPQRGWKKVRVIRNGNGGYTLQHADIAATTFTTVEISRGSDSFFKYISFENGLVEVEPAKDKWDFAWTYFSNATNFGAGEVPYLFQDIIIINRNVEVARVMEATKTFSAFNESSLTDASLALDWKTNQTAIGSDWRSGGGPGVSPAVRSDRYYIIKDGNSNYYKVRFTALTKNGERGYPAYETVLVKKG
ncbi:MAG TPA: HmuY family protein, partial [Chitinophagaceae bacterium]|nr:HmuY family protein [Chitinophagaceae bacterium]